MGPSKPTEVSLSECECFPCNAQDDRRGVEIFPPPEDHEWKTDFFSGREWVEDDGIAASDDDLPFMVEFWYEVHCTGKFLSLKVQGYQRGDFIPLWAQNGIDVILPVGSMWQLKSMSSDDMDEVAYVRMDSHGRHVWHMPCPCTAAENLVLESIEPTDTTPDPAKGSDLMNTAPDPLQVPDLSIADANFMQSTDLMNTGSAV